MKKKVLALLLVAAMGASMLVGCGGGDTTQKPADKPNVETPGDSTDKEPAGSEDTTDAAKGSVYMLNFKPETDQQWKDLAKIYTDKTGVEVTILTAAEGTYSTTMQAEMAKDKAPTIFNIGNVTAAQEWNDYTYDLKDSELYKHLADKSLVINYDGKVAGVANCYECYGIIYNKTILTKYCGVEGAVIKSLDELNSLATLKAVAEDINNRVDEINKAIGTHLTGAFASAGLDGGSNWRFSGHLAGVALYYEFLEDGCDLIAGEEAIDGKYVPNFKEVWDMYVGTSSAERPILFVIASRPSSDVTTHSKNANVALMSS